MNARRLVVLSACLCLAVLFASLTAVAASPDVSVYVDGESVDDGDTVEVEDATVDVRVVVDSGTTLSSVRTEAGTSSSIAALNRTTYNASQSISVGQETVFTAEVTDVEGTTVSHEVTLTRPTETATDAARLVDDLEDRVGSLEGEVDDLEERRNELERENENLTDRLNETADDGDDDGEGLPGFGFVAALVALSAVAAARRL